MFRLRHEEKKRTLCHPLTPGLTLAGRVLLAGCVVLVGFAWGLGLAGCAGRANGDASRDASSGSASAASTPTSTGDGTSARGARPSSYIDLHLHLDGAITPEIAKRLAEAQGIQLSASSDAELESLLTVPADCQSLNDFLKCFDLPLSLMQTPEGLSEAVRLVADNVRSQGVVYAEMRFAPQSHTKKGMTQEEAVLAALDGLKKTDLKANLILCCMRGEGNEAQNDETLALAEKYLVEDGGVVAIDLAGAEALYPTANYRDLFARAKAAGVPFTIHAGEADGPQSVRHAIEFGATRIGHGVRSHEDQGTVELVREKGVTLEMCPTSNRQTHAVEDMSRYPLVDFLNQGVKVTLNTDDMGIEGTTLADEFRYMERDFGLTAEQERTLLRNSVDAAFTSQEVKDQLRERLGL